MFKDIKKNKEGFTIIEVLIVLAIAGLILLIVFLAVPALQRNSRNTQRKNDVAALLGAISEYASNNNGALPTNVSAPSTGVVRFGCAAGTCTTAEAKVGYFNSGASLTSTAAGTVQLVYPYANTGPFNTSANDRVAIVVAATCTATGATAGGSARQVAALTAVENGPGSYALTGSCQES